MKKLAIILILFIQTLFTAYAQTGLAPNDSMALFQVLTINKKETPIIGQKVSFVNKENGNSYSGVSDETGRFSILIPKGKTYDIRVSIVDRDTTMRTFSVPSEPELITINYTFIDIPPRTIKLDRVYFDSNKATLRPESFDMLNNLVEYLTVKPYINIEIAGHTDNTGGYEFNITLSQQRAESVRNYLVKKGINTKRLKPVGYGYSRPIDTNDTVEGKQHNRRTEVYVTQE